MLRRGSLASFKKEGEEEGEEEEREANRARMGGESFDHILVPAEYYEAHAGIRLVCCSVLQCVAVVLQ